MRFLIVRTDIRAAADDELAAAWAQGECLRDEQTAPEQRRQTVRADDRDAALLLARALSSVGAVRSGRQRVKVLPVGRPEPRLRGGHNGGQPTELDGRRTGDRNSHPGARRPAANHRNPTPGDLVGFPAGSPVPAPGTLAPPAGGPNPQPKNLGPQSRLP
ncbi:hypothetical protein H4W31_002753 [Plantactinospora soyae]|uniref:Uncharacterized protein n=1 Tax=Plantactinospora soyae TaxID=1544732 RepID=A0A927M5C2_9ACTN|nr:hypothetical protein [Plantactinospora soyae]